MSEGFVYLIQSESGHYKIGKTTKSPESRIQSFKTGCPFPIYLIHKIQCEDCSEFERICHVRFAPKRTHGEWFLLNIEDVMWLKSHDYIEAGYDGSEEDPSWEELCISAETENEYLDYWIDLMQPLWGEL